MAEKVMDDQGVLREIVRRKDALERGLKFYFTGKSCKHGHITERYVSGESCVKCFRIRDTSSEKKEYMKAYYQDHKEQKKAYNKENKDQINEYRRERYANDPDYKTTKICRGMLERTLKATSSTKDSQTYEALGYCNEELKQNIESKLLPGMSWDNYGEWHIDHIYPVSRYIQDEITDPSIINALDNLIPMWDDHNRSKSAMTLEEFLEQEEELAEIYGEFLEAE